VTITAWSPGRVNLIGDHTDHTEGLALPMAIGLGVEVTGDRSSNWVILTSTALDGVAELPLDVEVPADVTPTWARYVAGVVAELRPDDGLSGTVDSTLPVGRGLSSSAALEIAVALALGGGTLPPRELAELGRRAEHRAVGVPCGIMDQLTMTSAVAGAALRLDCRSLEVEPVALPDGVDVVVADSGEARALARSPYATRVAECARAEAELGPLRDASPRDAESLADPVLRRRARHVTTENGRVDALVAAFRDGDLRHAGELMVASHASLRDDFEASTPGLDTLVQLLRGTPGVYGARLTGAGWGGCVVALTDAATELPHDLPVLWRGQPSSGAWVAGT
jgi:galactokinase